jgi:two-component system copper resistance phosphate regulon response regulator CusR
VRDRRAHRYRPNGNGNGNANADADAEGVRVKVLLLEDDADTARSICRGLARGGFDASHAADVPTALATLAAGPIDAAVLDLMVPGGGGYVVLERIRETRRHVPVLILTARDEVEDRVEGLERGADDYLVKPFAFAELLARLRALLRRPAQRVDPIEIEGLEIDPVRRHIHSGETRLDLTRTEFDLLLMLVERRGQVLNRELLLEHVWGYRFDPGTNVVNVHVNRLRRKLADVQHPDLVRTVRGVGYVVD